MGLMYWHRHLLKRTYGKKVSRTDAIRRRQHGFHLTVSKMEAREVDHVHKTAREMVAHLGHPNYGYTVFQLSRESGPGYKVSAYWGSNGPVLSQAYVFRHRLEAIRAAQHCLVLQTIAYGYQTQSKANRAAERRAYVGDNPCAQTVLWHRQREW